MTELSEVNKREVQRLIDKVDKEYQNGHGTISHEYASEMLYFLKRIKNLDVLHNVSEDIATLGDFRLDLMEGDKLRVLLLKNSTSLSIIPQTETSCILLCNPR